MPERPPTEDAWTGRYSTVIRNVYFGHRPVRTSAAALLLVVGPDVRADQRFRYGLLKNPTEKDADTPSPATMITISGSAVPVPRTLPASKAEAG